MYYVSSINLFECQVKVEVAVLGFPSQINLTVLLDIKHHERKKEKRKKVRRQASCDVFQMPINSLVRRFE